MATILILGAGMMGSALAVPLVDHGHAVRLVGTPLDAGIVASLRADGTHPKLRLPLPRQIVPYTWDELSEAIQGVDAIALGVSSAGIAWACEQLAPLIAPGTPLFMITKGLFVERGEVRCLPDVVRDRLPEPARSTIYPAAIAGPCIAGELARRVPTCVLVAGRDRAQNLAIARLIETPYYRPLPTLDVVGAETCAALKNAYAMGIALPSGMHERAGGAPGSVAMHNLESAIMAQAVLEMRGLVRALGGRPDTASGLAGVGDLDVTTNGGRTGRFGKLLGTGIGRDEAIARMEGATLECLEILASLREAFATKALAEPLERYPLASHLMAVALDGAPAEVPLERFFAADLAGDDP